MFKKYIEKRKQAKAFKKFSNSSLGISLADHTAECWALPRLANFSQESKQTQISEFYNLVFKIIESENPIEPLRVSLVELASKYSQLHVISLTTEDIKRTEFLDSSKISGQLLNHISEISEFVDALKEAKWKFPDVTDDELIDLVRTRSLLAAFYINGLNKVRVFLNDVDKDKDWFRPFINSSHIVEEDKFRELINQPSLLKDQSERQIHQSFADLIMQGHRNPYFEWDKCWNEWFAL